MVSDAKQAVNGYSLKRQKMKRWIYEHNHTQPYVARKLNLTVEEFKRKLREREHFNKEQLRCLIYLVGAENAFNIIYFPTMEEKRRVYQQAFGKTGKEGQNVNERDEIKQSQ